MGAAGLKALWAGSAAPIHPLAQAHYKLVTKRGRQAMIRLTAVAFALALASTAQALPPVAVQPADEMVTQVREACGAGMRRTAGGACVRTHARRAASRCARGVTC